MNNLSFRRLSLLLALLTTFSAFAQDQAPAPTTASRTTSWSPQARDATIGGAAGLLGGLLLNGRNRKVGGLIGGLAGAGAGYVLGQHQANQRKAAAAAAAQQAAAAEQAAAEAAAAQQAASSAQPTNQPAATTTASPKTQATTERLRAARAATARATAAHAAAERRLAASQRALDSQAHGTAPAVADLAVAAGYFPNPTFGQEGTAYPFSHVLRKSW